MSLMVPSAKQSLAPLKVGATLLLLMLAALGVVAADPQTAPVGAAYRTFKLSVKDAAVFSNYLKLKRASTRPRTRATWWSICRRRASLTTP